jgi:hypothetical protein
MINAQLNKFLIDMALAQRERVQNMVTFLTKAEEKILNGIDLDNLPLEQFGMLATTVDKLQKVLIDIMNVMQKLSVNDVGSGTGNIDVDELAYLLGNLDPEELGMLKDKIKEVKRGLKLVKKKANDTD